MNRGRTLRQRYVLERELGRGRVGVVFAGRDHLLEREVAIKLFESEGDEQFEDDFRREARLTAALQHPGIMPIYDFGRDDELLFIVMPLIHGTTLAELLGDNPLPVPLAAEIVRRVALALAHSHEHGIVHCDVKPANIMVAHDHGELRVKLMDFGLATLAGRRKRRWSDRKPRVIGTLPFVSPEHVRGEAPSPRADLYSLGAVFYQAVLGWPPFAGEHKSVLEEIVELEPVEPSLFRQELPGELDALILELLAKDAGARPADARRVAARIEPFADASMASASISAWPLVSAPLAGESADSWMAPLHDAVGRDRVLRAIDSRLIAARAGVLQLVLIRGELGIGKTTVLDELADACQQRQVELLRTSATSNEVGGWLGPFGELLTAGLAQRPEAIDLLAGQAARIVELFPALARSRLGRLAHKPRREPSWAGLEIVAGPRPAPSKAVSVASESPRTSTRELSREQTEDLLARAFGALVASGRAMTLAIDDAHLNAETVEMIDVLFRRLPHAPLVFVVAYEPAELGPEHPLARLARRLAQHPRALSLELGPLDQDAYGPLMKQLLGGGQTEPGLAERLYRESGGRPLFARELIRAALEAGVLVRREGVWYLEVASWPMPRSVKASVISRLHRLPWSLVDGLRNAAVLAVDDGELDFDELVDLTTTTPTELDHLMARALECGLLSERSEGGRLKLCFTSELVRRAIHDELSPLARSRLHRHCAARLDRMQFSERHHEQRQRRRLAHLLAGGAIDEARPLVVEQAHRAHEDGRTDELRERLARLIEVGDTLPLADQAELLLLLAEAEHARGQSYLARAALGRLATMLERGDEPRMSRLGERGAQLARQLERRSLADRLLGMRPRDRRAAQRERLAWAELRDLRPATSSRSMQIGDLLLMHGEYTAAREAYDSARRRAASEGDHEEEARQLQKLARVASKLGHYETAIAYCRDGLERLSGRHSLERVGLWALAAYAHCEAGQVERAEAELEAGAAELATFADQRSPDRDRVAAELERSRGDWLRASGDARAAITAYERCLALSPQNDRWSMSVARVNLGQACALAGHSSRALRELERASADKRAIGDRWGLVYAQTARVQVLRDLGQIRDAGEVLAETSGLSDEIEDPRMFALVHVELGLHALLSGKLDLATQEARRAKDIARRSAAVAELGAAYELLAAIDLARGELVAARHNAERAVATAEQHKLDGLLITSLLVLAEASEPERRPELFDRARKVSEQFANPYRELDVSLTSLRLGLGDPNHASDDYVALEQLSDRAENLSAQRHVGLCLLAQAEVLAPHDVRGALDHARLGEAQLRVLGAQLEADRASELVASLTLT